jgi:putative transposase
MPWSVTLAMDQKTQFIADYLRKCLSISELCAHYNISRKTGYKWIDRYLHDGPQGLEDLTRTPYSSPHRTPDYIEAALIELRSHHPSWGAKKLLSVLNDAIEAGRYRRARPPARS